MLNHFVRHTVYMIEHPAPPPQSPTIFPPQPEHAPLLPRQSRGVERGDHDGGLMGQHGPPLPNSRIEGAIHPGARDTMAIGMTLPNGSLGVLGSESEQGLLNLPDVSGPGRPHSVRPSLSIITEQGAYTNDPEARQSHPSTSATPAAERTTVSLASPDLHQHAQPPSYNEATERISIFIDGSALQALQESSESFSVGFLETIRKAQRDQYHFQRTPSHPLPQPFIPPTQTTRRPLPPLPTTARSNAHGPENVEAGFAHHLDGVVPRTAHSCCAETTHTCSGGCSAPKVSRCSHDCTLEQDVPEQDIPERGILEPHFGYGDKSLPKHAHRPQSAVTSVIEVHHPALPDTADLLLHFAPPQQPCTLAGSTCSTKPCGQSEAAQAPPSHFTGDIKPDIKPEHLNVMAEESLHVDELNVVERKPLSKVKKALLRQVEFGPKVDYSNLQLS